ncbi:YobI family P-loop NTPase [Psychrobacter vallis]|uniref:YobI family P-loop NTPase n=1 Tax=Psychrobacter vallis TaxID=248451 RepID=UPI00191868D9|nr:P-loop NTPase fold protein [Psychrobacter vallis]
MNQNSSAQSAETEQSDNRDFKITVLSPSEDLNDNESYKSYEKRLAAALKHQLVLNIALTGIYGSGKSSILNTFKKSYKNNSEWKFLEVSLSTFKIEKAKEGDHADEDSINKAKEDDHADKDSTDKETSGLTPDKIQLIERSILQQFFYAVPQSDIPLSRFKRITENSKESYREVLGVIIFGLWSYLYAFNSVGFITDLVEFANWYKYFNLVILIACTLFLIDKIFSYGFGLKEIKFNLHNAEFNIKNEQEKSILNDHLDEILYFFETTGKNVVIIEDLDRFNDTEIFIRLRELNSIINKSCPHRVVFIYAIRDDIFEDNERSKFFDYIIPVIPIVNPMTAYDIVIKEYSSIAKQLDNKFLLNTCLYFSDMRLLKNILNEYEVYFEQLQILDIDKNKLFAMVVYKNYHPNEFAKLNSNSGEIYNIFHTKKNEAIESLLKEKEKRVASLKVERENISNENLNLISELNSVYAYAVLNKLVGTFDITNYSSKLIQVQSKDKKYNVNEIASTETLEFFSKNQNIILYISNTGFKKELKFQDIENEVNSHESYLDRLNNVKAKENGKLEIISNEESRLKGEIQNIKKMKFEGIVKETSITIDKPLLKYFVSNGFIDETYKSYISYFFEESITLNDANYSLLVNSFNEPNFELELKKYNELVETYLGLDKLSTHSALNFSMLDFLLTDTTKKIYLEHYIKVICDGSSISIDFLKKYFKRNENLSILIPIIVDSREVIINDIGFSNSVSEESFNFRNFIKHIPFNRYQELDYLKQEFRRELSFMGNYAEFVLECFDGNFDRFKAFTDVVQPVLENATFSKSQVEELNWLGESKYLAINKHMIKQILVNNLEDSDTVIADLEVKPVTLMANSGINYLTEDVWSENLSEYIRIILLGVDEHALYSEDEDVYIEALNVFGSRNSIIERFIDITSTKIKDISKVENEQIRKYLVANSKVYYSWSNVFRYFSESYEDQDDQGVYREIDAALIKFLEDGKSDLQATDHIELDVLENEDWQSIKAEFDRHLFLSYQLSNESYKKVIGITDNNWDNSDLEGISQEKIQTLISLEKLSLTSENWIQVKEYASEETTKDFLVKYHNVIINNLDVIDLRSEDVITLLYAGDISNGCKEVLTETKAINLIESNAPVRKKIIEIYEDKKMSSPVYDQLLKHADSEELKKLLLKQIKYLDKQEILEILRLLDEPYQKLANGQEVEFENANENQNLLDVLNKAQIVIAPKAKKPKGSLIGEKVLTTRLQSHVLGG